MLNVVLLLVGFFLLIKGADFFVDASSLLAKKMRIPPIIIGLTLVAFGTSMPELAVSVSASAAANNEIALGNVIGSNIFNLLAVLGISAIITPVATCKSLRFSDYPMSIAAAVVLLLVSIGTTSGGMITVTDGCILLTFFGIYLYAMISEASKARKNIAVETNAPFRNMAPRKYFKPYTVPRYEKDTGRNVFINLLILGVGLVAIVFGGDLVVKAASALAQSFGISQKLIALTIVAIGTSLPELVTSIVAASKSENEIAIGNVVGSNIFNIFMILGLSAVINPINADMLAIVDIILLLGISIVFFVPIVVSKKVGRLTGAVMVITYIAYTVYIIIRV